MEKAPQAIHIAPLGVENERISEPAIRYDADRLILLNYLPRTPPLDDIHAKLEESLDEANIAYERIDADLNDLFAGLSAFASTIEDQREKDHVYVNVSSGNKIAAIAGMIACMSTNQAKPYYVKAEEQDSNYPKPSAGSPAKGIQNIETIPRYPMDRPETQHLAIMNYIINKDTRKRDTDESFRTKRKLFEYGEEVGLPFMKNYDGETEKGKFMKLNHHILDPLKEDGYIIIEEHHRDHRVKLTDDGKNTLRAFKHLVEVED